LLQRVHNELWFIRVALLKVIERFVKDADSSFFTADRLSAILDELQRNLEDTKYAGVRISGMETLDALVTKLDGTSPDLYSFVVFCARCWVWDLILIGGCGLSWV